MMNEVTLTPMTLDLNKIQSAYSGRNGACACGCSGKHWYPKRNIGRGLEVRGYEIWPDEVSDSQIKRIANVIVKVATAQQSDGWDKDRDGWIDMMTPDWVAAVKGTRQYIVYWEDPQPGFVEAHGHLALNN
jgi:hypothetical protein